MEDPARNVAPAVQLQPRLGYAAQSSVGDLTLTRIGFGTKAELGFMCEAFQDALGLTADPLGESAYALPPHRSRVMRQPTIGGVMVSLYPPKVGPGGVAMVVMLFVIFAYLDNVIRRSNPAISMPDIFSARGTFHVGLATIIIGGLLLRQKYLLLRAVTGSWIAGTLHLTERSLLNPCNVKWSGEMVDSFAVEPLSRGRATLLVKLKDGATVPLIIRSAEGDIRVVYALIITAISRARGTSQNDNP